MATNLKVGDVVKVSSDEPPKMTIIDIDKNDVCRCAWFNARVCYKDDFPAAALKKV